MSALALFFSLTATILGIKTPEKNAIEAKPAVFTPSEKIIAHKLGDKTISFRVIQYGETVNTCCVNLHDDEMTSVKAARSLLEQQGYTDKD